MQLTSLHVRLTCAFQAEIISKTPIHLHILLSCIVYSEYRSTDSSEYAQARGTKDNATCSVVTHFVFAGNVHLVAKELSQMHDGHGGRTAEEPHAVLLRRNESAGAHTGFIARGLSC